MIFYLFLCFLMIILQEALWMDLCITNRGNIFNFYLPIFYTEYFSLMTDLDEVYGCWNFKILKYIFRNSKFYSFSCTNFVSSFVYPLALIRDKEKTIWQSENVASAPRREVFQENVKTVLFKYVHIALQRQYPVEVSVPNVKR